MIKVQTDDFDIGTEYQKLRDRDCGAVVTFSGCVRQENDLQALHLEHYPGMTECALEDIVIQAKQRWPLGAVTVIHRIGRIDAGEQIVFVGVASGHRSEAFAAGEFIMDFLKTRAPFWKKEIREDGERWVEAKDSDNQKVKRWD
ncbi:molybdopterin synthase catalytic subunit MoaE [Porticoccus sp. W117]|uniref:molybdopterin synthase catalytic subunit MoaE n=1 Tax=Porticoccus sp. W117 TaxID=3054777 RepID=UPI002595665A|nr:molybdopterin synthase catalytic subunit MoaE [Porticoccus sp. W117]MDM3871884.1 molybdopterin synthase catalytic subunit MoaE [Porticoccus sp. W117]